MRYNQEKKETHDFYTQSVEGEFTLAGVLENSEASAVFEQSGLLTDEDIQNFREVSSELEETARLLVFTGNAELKGALEGLNSEFVIYLPTVHEAEEAMIMNQLERQFRSEMGDS
ncbi:hypothetical protein [Jiulongibacter sp. NS-SX5]|uniref:hypothetical protein n=1 Tax=Jiulongibacter sp. NS-SX5 TaxID=3463854 RepID=UPI004059CA92